MADKAKAAQFGKYPQRLVRLPVGTTFWPKVHDPDEYEGQRKFKIEVIFPPGTDLSELMAASQEVYDAAFPKRKLGGMTVLIKNGDEREKDGKPVPEFIGREYIRAACNENYPPQIIGRDRQPLPAGVKVGHGDSVKVIVQPIPSNTPTKGTITFRLWGIQLLDKAAGGSRDVSSLFDEEPGGGFGRDASDDPDEEGAKGTPEDDDDLPF